MRGRPVMRATSDAYSQADAASAGSLTATSPTRLPLAVSVGHPVRCHAPDPEGVTHRATTGFVHREK